MIDLIITHPSDGPAALFTRNFRTHAGIPIGLYTGGPRLPVALIYGETTNSQLAEICEHYEAVIVIPSMENDRIPESPGHYETMTLKAPILATLQSFDLEGYTPFVKTFEGGPLVVKGRVGDALVLLFTADLVKATIRILSGELERESGKDKHGRPKPPQENITCAPGVSLHFNLIANAMRYVYRKIGKPFLSIPRWPSSAPLALFLSHDVDVVRKWTVKRSMYEQFKSLMSALRFNFKPMIESTGSIYAAMKGRDPYWKFDDLLFMESGQGFKSTWFFAPFGGEYNVRENDIDPVYHRKSAEITAMIRRITDNGCELALHGTRKAFFDEKVLKKQIESFEDRLGWRLKGVRHHYLMFRHGQTFEAEAAAGLSYDATMGFSDRVGFRNGMASPFFPYPADHPAGSLVELPLNFMDSVFLHSPNGHDVVSRHVTESYLYAKAAGGLFSALVHPGNMDSSEIPGLAGFYQSLLSRFRMDNAHSMTGAELSQWWLTRENVLRNMEYGGDMWRIKDIPLPPDMDIQITAPNLKNMRFAIDGSKGGSKLTNDTLTIRPGEVDPHVGVTIIRKS